MNTLQSASQQLSCSFTYIQTTVEATESEGLQCKYAQRVSYLQFGVVCSIAQRTACFQWDNEALHPSCPAITLEDWYKKRAKELRELIITRE